MYGIQTGYLHGSQRPSNRAAGVNPPTSTQVRAKSTLDRQNTELHVLASFPGRFVGGGKNVNRPGNEATEITCTCLQPLIYMYIYTTICNNVLFAFRANAPSDSHSDDDSESGSCLGLIPHQVTLPRVLRN